MELNDSFSADFSFQLTKSSAVSNMTKSPVATRHTQASVSARAPMRRKLIVKVKGASICIVETIRIHTVHRYDRMCEGQGMNEYVGSCSTFRQCNLYTGWIVP